MDRGYVKVWRKMADSGIFTDHRSCALFLYLLLHVTHKPIKVMVRGNQLALSPGQFFTGRFKLAAALGCSVQNTRTALRTLEKAEILTTEPTSHGTIITLVNWHTYQSENSVPNQQTNQDLTRTQPGPNQDLTTKQEVKNVRSKELKEKRGNAHRFVPPTLDEVTGYCRERMNTIDPEAFCAHYASKGWKVGTSPMVDWRAAVITWEKKEVGRRINGKERLTRRSTAEIAAQMAHDAYLEELHGKESGFGDCDTNFPALPLLD